MAFRSFGVDQGLSNLSTVAMAQDHDGFLWVGTEDGLFRQEGDKFRRFGEAEGLPSARIDPNGISVGKTRGLWVSTSRGLVFWDGLSFLRPSAMGMKGLDGRPATCLPQGGVILSDQPSNTRFLGLDGHDFTPLSGLPWGNGLTASTYSAEQDLFLAALGQELWARHRGVWSHRDLSPFLGQDIRVLRIDSKGQIWMRCTERLAKMANLNATVESLTTPIPLAAVNSSNLGVDGQGRLWTNAPQGLVWLDGQNSGVIGLNEGLPQGGAVVLCVDHQGTVWIGGEGCHKLLGEGLWTGWTRKQGLPTDIVWTITRTQDGLLWAGTAAGLARGDERGWKMLPQTHGNQFMALAEDVDGNLWAGHLRSTERPAGLSVRAKGASVLQPVSIPGLIPEGSVASLLAEGTTLWVGTTSAGLLRATRKGTSLTFQPITIGNWPRLDSIQRIISDGHQGLWVAGSHGLAHWNGQTWVTLDKSSGLPEDTALTIAAMPNGEAWASFTEAIALVRIRRQGERLELLETLRAPHPLLKNPIITMISQLDGILWLGTSRGLLRWDGHRVERYGRHTGLPGEDCAQNALWFDPNGDVWVGLSVGLAKGRLALRTGDQTPPPAQIFAARRGDEQSVLVDKADRLIPWAFRTLTFNYGPKGSLRTEDLSYQVRLIGIEDRWRDTTLPESRYPSLGAGVYRFEVRTVNSVGETGGLSSVDFRILAPWWLRPWFLVLAGLLVVGLSLLGFRWRTQLLRRHNLQLEALVHARTLELEIANSSLLEASLIDPLTGLHNRRFLSMTMPEEEIRLHRMFRNYLQKGENPLNRNEDLVLFLGDLDHFKHVNDTYGHAAGDLVLQQTAQVLRGVCRTSDTLVRWGGEEFLLVAKRSDREKAHQIAEKLCQAMRYHTFVLPDEQTLHCTMSIGYAAFPILDQHPEAMTWEDTLQVADQCMYAAKHAGRDGWVGMHTPGPVDAPDIASRFRVDLESLVREGQAQISSSFPEGRAFGGRDIRIE